ncbi:FecCD family ABC transporter permease [Nocardioides coralli]|uniref:FecCD family ABC transporter permease n=1 Tax=Nocardioides coralli TaxID=2872154 RepID=UPI001CA3C9DC|nr:iron ABC transporter permease [Nocardioides coralli]QZY28241.1 iron ABC transporter permease [Nocardioides coralli]
MALDLTGERGGAAAAARARALRRLAARPHLRWTKVGLGAVVCLGAVLVGCLVGPAGLGVRGVLLELVDAVPGVEVDSGMTLTQQAIFWEIRLPRVVLGVLVGAMLAAAGTAYQGVFRNPLADPYLLGISSGAGLGATVGIVAGGGVGPVGIPLLAFVGGLLGVAATYALGSTVGAGRGAVVIVLAGVAVGAFFNAIQNFVQQQYDDSLLSVYSWMLGRLSTDGWSDVVIALPYVVVSCAVILVHRRVLDVMAVGDVEAASLGVDPARVRLVLVVTATLGTAAVVSVSGLIGFVGIVVPHAVRLLFGAAHHTLLPLALLLGAAFLVLADVVARTALAPSEVPIGVVTALVGAPFFLVVLRRHRGTL